MSRPPEQIYDLERSVEEFARSLDKGQTRAVHASKTEWKIEGPYWLAEAHPAFEPVLAGSGVIVRLPLKVPF